jgi:hypothetical protein
MVRSYKDEIYDLQADFEIYQKHQRWMDFGRLLSHMTRFEEEMKSVFQGDEPSDLTQKNMDRYDDIMDWINANPDFATPCKEGK